MTASVQNLENGFSRAWGMADLDGAMQNAIGAMATGSFNLIGVAAIKLTIGVYVDDLKLDAVKAQLIEAMAVLNYGKSSRYALVSAAIDVARDLVKRLGRPDGVERNAFWQMLEGCGDVMEATAFMVAAIKSQYGVDTVQALTGKLKGDAPKAPKAEKSREEKVAAVMEGAGPGEAMATVEAIVNQSLGQKEALTLALKLAGQLTVENLAQLASQLGEMIEARTAEEFQKAA